MDASKFADDKNCIHFLNFISILVSRKFVMGGNLFIFSVSEMTFLQKN